MAKKPVVQEEEAVKENEAQAAAEAADAKVKKYPGKWIAMSQEDVERHTKAGTLKGYNPHTKEGLLKEE